MGRFKLNTIQMKKEHATLEKSIHFDKLRTLVHEMVSSREKDDKVDFLGSILHRNLQRINGVSMRPKDRRK